MHNRVRVEIDFCARTAAIYAGSPTNAPLRMIVPTGPIGSFTSVYFKGAYGATFYDALVVSTDGQ